jgi:plasmid stability protein
VAKYTLRHVPPELHRALRERARVEGKSLNQVTLEALGRGLEMTAESARRRNLSDLVGSWKADPETESVLREQRRIDPNLWAS